MLARRQADGVASIVVAIGVALFHVANLAMTDEVGTPGSCLAVCRTEDQFGSGKRCKRHRHVLTVDLLELGVGMDAGDDCAAEIARRLQAFLESGEPVKRAQLVDEEPAFEVLGARHRHQRIHRRIEPQREQLRAHAHVDVARGDEDHRATFLGVSAFVFMGALLDPVADRKAAPGSGQELQRLGVHVEHCPDRFRHARGFRSSQGIGDRASHHGVDPREISGHQFAGKRSIGAPPFGHQLEAELDEQGTRRDDPELRLPAPVMGYEGFRCRPEFTFGAAFVEEAPLRTARVERVQNDVPVGLVEVFDESAGEVEDDAALSLGAGFGNHVRHGDCLAHAGGPDEHGVALFEPPGIDNRRKMRGPVWKCRGQFLGRTQMPFPTHGARKLSGALALVVPAQLIDQFR